MLQAPDGGPIQRPPTNMGPTAANQASQGPPGPINQAPPGAMQGAAAQRYAYIRLGQAVQAGLIPASVLQNAHPEQYAALWRLVSQNVTAPAQEAGYADPGQWLRNGGVAQQPIPGGVPPTPGGNVGQANVPPNQVAPNPPLTGAPNGPTGQVPWQHPYN